MSLTNLSDSSVVKALSLKYGHEVDIVRLENYAFKAEVADATLKFLAPTPEGEAGFMLVSGTGNPYLVQRAVDNIQIARNSTSDNISAPILLPVTTGEIEGQTFAVWPLKRPFMSSNRVMRRLKGRIYSRRITQWATELCQETLTPASPETVLGDLSVIINDAAFPDDIRREAKKAEIRLSSGQWKPMHCLQHGDFWAGNLLLPNRSDGPEFYVIDWAGMKTYGYPFMDLARILMSLRCNKRFRNECFKNMCRNVGCDQNDVTAYILSAYGQIGANLEHFPPDRFREATLNLYRFTKTI